MDVMVPYLYNSIDKAASLASPYVSPEKLDQVCRWLKQHDEAVLYSTLGALVLGTLYLASSGNDKTKKRSKKPSSKKSYQVKVKKEKVVPVDPVKQSYDTINSVKDELKNVFTPQVDQLEKDVERELAGKKEIEGKKNKHKKKKAGSKNKLKEHTSNEAPEGAAKTSSYKDSTKYRYLYLNEALLKLLMRLDGVETQGIEDIRVQRKATIKLVQEQCKRVDALKDYVN